MPSKFSSSIERLKVKWEIESNWRLVKILFVFAITGMSSVQIRKLIFPILGISEQTPWYIYLPVWLILITPFYYAFMVLYAHLFGEWKFFKNMMIHTWNRIKKKRK
jgi:hypothetical protein